MPFDGPAPMSTTSHKPLATRERLSEVRYEIRGELARRARELEAQGRKLIKLNIGSPLVGASATPLPLSFYLRVSARQDLPLR